MKQEEKSGFADSVQASAGYDLRMQALELLRRAQAVDGMAPVFFTHSHEYGATGYLIWPKDGAAGNDEAMLDLAVLAIEKAGIHYDEERGESIDVFGGDVSLEDLCGAFPASDEEVRPSNDKTYSVISFDEDMQIHCDHILSDCSESAFAIAARKRQGHENTFVVAIAGATEVEYPGEGLVDSDTIIEQEDVFPSPAG